MGVSNIQRRLAEGVASWLQFEFHCQRGDLFGERYLASPVGQILAGAYLEAPAQQKKDETHQTRIVSEVNHPILAADGSQGRPPQVDFAIKKDKAFQVVVETKWAGRSAVTLEQLLWDLLRLESIAYRDQAAECYFVLAGFRKKLEPLLATTHFGSNHPPPAPPAKLITVRTDKKLLLYFDRASPSVQKALDAKKASYPHVAFPDSLSCSFPHCYPKEGHNMTFQVYAWRVYPHKRAQRSCSP